MKDSRKDLIKYRLARAKETYEDAQILADNNKWNSTINRLYYAAYYAISALLLNENITTKSHPGTKQAFSNYFIKEGIIPKEYGKMFSQLFTWRQKGDYDDLFDFNREKVLPYFEPVKTLIEIIDQKITE